MNKIFDYTNLTLNELIEKISIARFFHLPKMVAEAFRKLNSRPSYEPPYKVYTALLTQSGTDAPVATVLQNTLGGDIVWSYESIGQYIAEVNGLFMQGKTTLHISNKVTHVSAGGDMTYSYVNDTDSITINTYKFETPDFVHFDSMLDKNLVEIRVYN